MALLRSHMGLAARPAQLVTQTRHHERMLDVKNRRRRLLPAIAVRFVVVVGAGCVPQQPARTPRPAEWCAEGTIHRDYDEPLIHPICDADLAGCERRVEKAHHDGGYQSIGVCTFHERVEAEGSGCANAGGTDDSGGGCVKGCRCGNACIDCSDTCHGGATYRKRRH